MKVVEYIYKSKHIKGKKWHLLGFMQQALGSAGPLSVWVPLVTVSAALGVRLHSFPLSALSKPPILVKPCLFIHSVFITVDKDCDLQGK